MSMYLSNDNLLLRAGNNMTIENTYNNPTFV